MNELPEISIPRGSDLGLPSQASGLGGGPQAPQVLGSGGERKGLDTCRKLIDIEETQSHK